MLMWLLIGLCAAAAITQIYIWWRLCSHQLTTQEHLSQTNYPSVSIVVASYNEAQNLPNLIPSLLSQDYKDYEIIIVDDGSIDETVRLLEQYKADYLKIIKQAHLGKKAALSRGISSALGTWIVCTDADCRPASDLWLNAMLADHEEQDVILGYGPYEATNVLSTNLQQYETWYIAIQYLVAALMGKAYMGVGRNLAFRKSVFDNENGYDQHKNIKSGDDDLFIGAIADSYRVGIAVTREAWVYSEGVTTWNSLWQQKRRHLTTAPRYKPAIQLKLMIIFMSHLLTYLMPILLAMVSSPWFLLIIIIRWIYLLVLSKQSMTDMGLKELWKALPILDLILVIYYCLHGLAMPWQKQDW